MKPPPRLTLGIGGGVSRRARARPQPAQARPAARHRPAWAVRLGRCDLGVAMGRERQRFGLGRNDADGAHEEHREHMTLHRRTLHWFRRLGLLPRSAHYMVKNVLIGKNAAAKGAQAGHRRRGSSHYGLFCLNAASWLTARFRERCDQRMNPILSGAVVHTARGTRTSMPVQRKVFRIEEGARLRAAAWRCRGRCGRRAAASRVHDGAAVAARADRAARRGRSRRARARAGADRGGAGLQARARPDLRRGRAHPDRDDRARRRSAEQRADGARASRELAAIVGSTEQATQSILQAAEEIDQAANTLSASVKGSHEQGLAHDIQDRVVQIFEACNFQDLTGQRVASCARDAEVRRGARRPAAGDLA